MADRKTLVQRIAMDGGDDIRAQLEALGADGRAAFAALKDAADDSGRAGRDLNKSLKDTQKEIAGIKKSADGIGRALTRGIGTVITFLGLRALKDASSAWIDYEGRVRNAIGATEDVNDVMDRLHAVANRTFSSIDQTLESFLRFSPALRELGLDTAEILDVVEAVNNALVVSGAKGQRAATVSEALAKAFALGALRGENLNTVIAQGGEIAQLLADHFNTTTGGLLRLGEQGAITGKVMAAVFEKALPATRKAADAMAVTINDALQIIENNIKAYIGNADEMTGASRAIAEVLKIVANNLDIIIPLLALFVAGLAVAKVLTFGTAIVQLVAGLAALGPLLLANPITAFALALTAATLAVLYLTGNLDGFIEKAGGAVQSFLGIGAAGDESAARVEGMADRANAAIPTVGETAQATAADMSTAMAGAAEESGSVWEAATGFIGASFARMGDEIAGVWDAIVAGARAALDWVKRLIAGANQAAQAAGGGGGPSPQGLKRGGGVRGPGTGTSDSILARLSNGEFVIRADAARWFGTDFLNLVNSGRAGWRFLQRSLAGFADGGLVDAVSGAFTGFAPQRMAVAAAPAGQRGFSSEKRVRLDLSLDGQVYEMLTPESTADRLVRYANRRTLASGGRKPGWY